MPANTCMIFTTLGYNQESHPMALTSGRAPEVTAVDIYEKSSIQKITVGESYQIEARFTPSISKAEMEWRITDYFGKESDIATIDANGKLIANRAGQFKVVENVKGHPEMSDTLDMSATTTQTLIDNLVDLDIGTYEGIVRDDNSANFNNIKTIKRADSDANGNPGVITYHANGIYNFEFKAFSLNTNLSISTNFVVEASLDNVNWEQIECNFEQQAKLSSNWYPYIITPKSIDVLKNYQYLRITLNSKGYKTYDPQFGGGSISYGAQTPSEIEINNNEEFVVTGETLQFNASVLPESVSQEVIYKVLENNGEATTKATIDNNGLLTAKEVGHVTVVVETADQSLATYYPLQIVGGYFVDDINDFHLMYDYGSFTYENNQSKFGEAPLINRTEDTPQSIAYAFNGISKVTFEAFSNSTFGDNQATIYMSEDGISYDAIEATFTKIGTAPGASDFSKYKVSASVDTDKYNFVKFEIKNDSKIYNPMIAKAEIIYNESLAPATHINVVEDRIVLNAGNHSQINVKFASLNTQAKLTYESLDSKIAIVDENGLITAVSTGSTIVKVSLNENEFIEIPVNVLEENFALNKNVEVTSTVSSQASSAVDGDYSTRWGSRQSQTAVESIIVDLGEVKTIDTVKIFWETARALDYDLEIAGEDQQFRVIKEMRGIENVYNDILQFEPTEARYVKMSGKKPVTKYGYSIYELEVYNNSNYVNVESVSFDNTSKELYVGQEVELDVKVNPTNATCPLPSYTSSNENAVKVINGKMLAVKAGHAIITADVDGKKSTLEVDVVDVNEYKIANELTALSIKNGKVQLPVFDGYTLSIASSSHEKVIQLDGTVNTPVYDTAVDIVVNVSKNTRSNNKVLTKPITLNVVGDDALLNVLETKIEDAKRLDGTLYKPSTYVKMNQTLLEAKKVFNVQNLLVKEVKDALNKLDNAIQSLELKEDRTTLNKQLKIYKELDEKLYTKASYQRMMSIIKEIESSINDDSSQKDIESVIKKLNTISSILIKQTDYDMVKNKIEELEKVHLEMYTTQSVKTLKKAINTAKAYLRSSTMTNQGLFDQYASVMKAYGQLQMKVNVDILRALIAKMEKEDLSSYTVKSVKHLKTVISKVKGQLDDDLTEQECIELMQQLQDAYHALVKTNHPKTSDSVVLGTYIVLGMASILGLFIFKKRKEQEIK